ncbi:MAG TPA: metal ABC transporter permease [Candidatus Sulfotelmatobacter sp.]|nr:metal ABC transporter permease [Candidatus Sulfotelmatobacter sp.]
MSFSLNLFADLQEIFRYDFMQHAFEAGTVVAIVAGVVGYFVVLRRSSFAAHSLAHIGFAGGAGAVLVGIQPVYGLLLFTTIGGSMIALLSPKAAHRDVSIGTVLAFMLGLGALFISLYRGNSAQAAYSILFGEILGISSDGVLLTFVASLIIISAVALVYRPLLFSSVDEDVAEAKGLPTFFLGIVFMLLVAVATSIAVQVVGVLLIFSLMVTPAAIAQQLAKRPQRMMIISILVALLATWLGLIVAFYEPYPVSFFITSIVFISYLIVRFTNQFVKPRMARQQILRR